MVDKIKCNSVECNFIEHDRASSLNNQQFRLNKINENKDYFISEIKERELMSKRLSKYIVCCDYFDKFLGIASAGLRLTFSLPTGFARNC